MNTELHGLIEGTDEEFNAIYPKHIRKVAKKHWTPIDAMLLAIENMVQNKFVSEFRMPVV